MIPDGPRTVLLAAPRSFCAGVDRAIEIVERELTRTAETIYVRKQIVHNTHVVADLQSRGVVFVDELDEVPRGALVVFSAHGVSPEVRADAVARDLRVVDATCPLVAKVHAKARRLSNRGETIVLIGHGDHEEVEGTIGHAPEAIQLVETVDDVAAVTAPDPSKVTYITQTTLAVDDTADIVAGLKERFPALREPQSADICYATTNRQRAVSAVAASADLVLVLGSGNSSNSQRLVDVARRHHAAAHLIEDVGDIDPEWLIEASTVGISAGASAPAHLVDEVISYLEEFGPVVIKELEVTREDVHFALPPEKAARDINHATGDRAADD